MKLGKGFLNLKEGSNQTLLISKVTYDKKYDKAKVTFEDERGATCVEQYGFTKKDGKPNEVSLNIFTTLVMCAMNNFEMQESEFEPKELEGHYVIADVVKDEYVNEDTGKKGSYMHVRNFQPAEDMDPAEVEESEDEAEDEDLFD